MQGMHVNDVPWLSSRSSASGGRTSRPSPSDSIKRTELLRSFLAWLFDGFIIDLLRVGPKTHRGCSRVGLCYRAACKADVLLSRCLGTCPLPQTSFYVTESAALQRMTLYFLQNDWKIICQPLVEHMASTHLTKIDKVRHTSVPVANEASR